MRGLVTLGIALLLAAAAGAQEETRRHASEDGKYSFAVPNSWEIGPVSRGKAEFGFEVEIELEGQKRWTCQFRVWRLEGMRNVVAQAHMERLIKGKDYGAKSVRLGMKPLPHIEMIAKPDSDRPYVIAIAYHMVRRIGFAVEIYATPAKAWPPMRDAALAVAKSFQAKVEVWPKQPKGFAETVKDGHVYFLQPGVKKAAVTRMAKIFKKVEKEFASRYGPVVKDPDNPAQVVLYTAKIQIPVKADSGYRCKWEEGRLYGIPLPRDKSLDHMFAQEAVALLFAQKYGLDVPWWLVLGEEMAMRSLFKTGKRHPWIYKSLLNALPHSPRKLDVLAADKSIESFESYVYYALLRSGKKKYRKAFKAYLEGVVAYEWQAAFQEHLAPLDSEKLQDDAIRFVRIGFKLAKDK